MLVCWADGTNDLFGAESKCNVQVALPKFKLDKQSRQQVLKQHYCSNMHTMEQCRYARVPIRNRGSLYVNHGTTKQNF